MSANLNPTERRLLDSAANILRRRAVPGARFYALVEGIPDPALSPLSELGLPYTERLARLADPGQPQVGDMPPQPPTLRGRAGAVLVNVVRRMLFWYTGQIRAQNRHIAAAAREQARVLHQISEAERRGRESLEELAARLAEQEQLAERQGSRIEGMERAAAARMAEMERRVEEENRRARAELAAALDAALLRLRDAEHRAVQLERLLKMSLAAQAPPEPGLEAEMRRLDDHFFAAHAEAFRGERAEIKRRLAVYLPYARHAHAATGNLPALDLGCGRGEWLEVLAEAGIPARGIDSNRELAAACRARSLDVTEAALPAALRAIPAGSHAIVSAVHVLEHLSFPDLLEVVDHTVRILKPGGVAIFETPNPKNLFVSSNNFYLDPTHRLPLPGELLAFVLEARGLAEARIIPLEPYPESYRLPETDATAGFINQHFFGPQDYGIVATRPAPVSLQ